MAEEYWAEMAQEAGIEYEGVVQSGEVQIPDPEVQKDELGNLSITWDDGSGEILQVQINKLSMQKDGMYSYFSTRKSNSKGKWTWVLEPGRINWYSMSSKTSLRRELDGREKRWDWKTRLAQVVVICAQTIKNSSQAVDLSKVDGGENVRWCCYPVVEQGEHTVLFAPGGVGKSLLSLGICVQTATGERVVPGTDPPEQPMNVLYLDWETNAKVHARRMASIAKGVGVQIPEGRVFYWRMEFALEESIEDIRAFIKLNHIGLVIVDSAGLAANGDINSTEVGTAYIKTVRAIGDVAILTITHMSWEQMEKGKGKTLRPIGSVYFQNGPRSSWGLIGEQDETGEKVKHLGLVHVKSNNDMLRNPIGFQADFSDKTAVKWTSESVHTSQQIAQHVSLVKRIEELLTVGRWTIDSMLEELPDAKRDTVKRSANRLVRSGFAQKQGDEYVANIREAGYPDQTRDKPAQYDMNGMPIAEAEPPAVSGTSRGTIPPKGELSRSTSTNNNNKAKGQRDTSRQVTGTTGTDDEMVSKMADLIESKKQEQLRSGDNVHSLDWDSGETTEKNDA
jgi:hypothetical protein